MSFTLRHPKLPRHLVPLYNSTAHHVRTERRHFHEYFVTHLPSSSLHPDARSAGLGGPHHKLPRDKSVPHDARAGSGRAPATAPPNVGLSREMTTVRIPLRSAKHHFGASVSRGSRPYNEDTFQAGTIEIPAFATRQPMSFNRSSKGWGAGSSNGEGTSAVSSMGDPQVFYFGVFDGHGGNECSDFLKDRLHEYVEEGAKSFSLSSTIKGDQRTKSAPQIDSEASREQVQKVEALEKELINSWKELVGGYFRRFKPEYFSLQAGGRGHMSEKEAEKKTQSGQKLDPEEVTIETVMEWAFLRADYDFIAAQADKREDPVESDRALNEGDILDQPSRYHGKPIGGTQRFKGGSTCSVAMISTPTPTPFWNPASPSTIVTSHVGDTRILLCKTSDGKPVPMTSDHHPNDPYEAARMRRYAATFVTDSFGEERVQGLANTRAFGDMASKRIGVTPEPEIRRLEIGPAEYSFLVLISDGISGTLSDQEVVDIAKEARTPEQAARDIVGFATEVSVDADNATALVVRLGGWERRSEGGVGSMGTKEGRDFRREEAADPRRRH